MAHESGIDLVVVNPSFVVGPLLAPQPTSTLLLILAIVKGLHFLKQYTYRGLDALHDFISL